jgi:hypothetical protein
MNKIGKKLAAKGNSQKKLRKIMRELIVLLGHGEFANSIPEAVAKLMERNYPELVKWSGKDAIVIFIPEYYLSRAFKYVDPSKIDQKLEYSKQAAEAMPERKQEFKEHEKFFLGGLRTCRGEAPELDLYNALKKRSEVSDESIAIFHSLEILKFDPERQDNNINEKDFILVSGSHGYIMAIEVKKTLNKKEAEKSLIQLKAQYIY